MAKTAIAKAAPIDTFIGPVAFATDTVAFLGNRDSVSIDSQNNRSFVTRRSLRGSGEPIEFSVESVKQLSSINVGQEEQKDSFSTAAELFDDHPESLEGVFDFEIEDAFAALIV